TTSNSTAWPSVRDLYPSPSIAEKWTNTSSSPSREMNPKPFSLLNHFTVPCSANVPSCAWSARSVARPARGAQRTGGATNHVAGGSPVGVGGGAIVVLEAERVVLGRIAVGDLEHPAACGPGVRDPMRRLCAHHGPPPRGRIALTVADLHGQPRVEHDPHLVPHLVVVDARLLAGLHGDHADRARLGPRGRHDLAPGLVDDHGSASLGSCSRSDAISIAAVAASHPLFPCLPPARSSACSSVSVVRTPNVTGTPVASAASRIPAAACPAMSSKCAVSPRITAPRQITASNVRDRASRRATRGSSNAPGTHTTSTSSSATPFAWRPASAPSSSLRVTSSLNLATAIAKRRPRACRSPRSSLTAPPPARGCRAGGPASRAWCAGSRCSPRWGASRAARARRSTAHSPRARAASPGYLS